MKNGSAFPKVFVSLKICMKNLKKQDPKIYNAIKNEIKRQQEEIVLIASENYSSEASLEAMGTPLSNKYSEGYPGKRYYAGNKFIDIIEQEAIDRARKIFKAEHANVQPHSGSQANQAVYMALLEPGDKVMGMSLDQGGHLTHGSLVNASGKLYKFFSYGVDRKTEKLNYAEIEKIAKKVRPKLIVCGATAYPGIIDFRKFRRIADKVGAYLMADVAHIAGLVVAGVHPHPFPHCDVVTTTTHKTLRGPRAGLILCKTKDRLDPNGKVNLAKKIDKAVFPGLQGGPLDHIIAAKAVIFKEAMRPEFKKYQRQIVKNAKALADELKKEGFRIVSGGTENHLLLVDLSAFKVSSTQVQNTLEKAGIHANRNAIPFDTKPPFDPSGLRLGTPAITSRGFKEKECRRVGQLIAKVVKNINDKKIAGEVLREVKALCKKFPVYKSLK